MTKNSIQKFKYLENKKRLNKKHFSSFLKGFSFYLTMVAMEIRKIHNLGESGMVG